MVATIVLGCVILGLVLMNLWLDKQHRDDLQLARIQAQQELMLALDHVALVSRDAMELVKASSLDEHERVHANREAHDVQIQTLRDTMAKQAQIVVDQTTAVQRVRLEDGREINKDDVDWLE